MHDGSEETPEIRYHACNEPNHLAKFCLTKDREKWPHRNVVLFSVSGAGPFVTGLPGDKIIVPVSSLDKM